MFKILQIVGARPNFMKAAPIARALRQYSGVIHHMLVHTGQHYDSNMSDVFFTELDLPIPDINLEAGSGSHAQQTASVMMRIEPVLLDYKPDWVVVPGDVNSTLACTLVASKLGFRVAHVEAGLRSFDRTMPEELNRIVTDALADVLFTPSADAGDNLRREGVAESRISFVGNVMIDSVARLLPRAESRWESLAKQWNLSRFILATLHRPGNVEDAGGFRDIITALNTLAESTTVVFPVHPRTRIKIDNMPGVTFHPNVRLVPPCGYLDFLALEARAALVITDSGGVQEETTYLGTPCLTVRANTERPTTITMGTNELVGRHPSELVSAARRRLSVPSVPVPRIPPLWDGFTGERIVGELLSRMGVRESSHRAAALEQCVLVS